MTTLQKYNHMESFIKRFKIACVVCLVLFFVMQILFVALPAFAVDPFSDTLTLGGTTWDLTALKGHGRLTFRVAYFAYGLLSENIATTDSLAINTNGHIWVFFRQSYNSFKNVGVILALMWVVIDLIEHLQLENMSAEQYLRFAIKLLVCVAFIDNGFWLCEKAIEFGEAARSALVFTQTAGPSPLAVELQKIYDQCNKNTFFNNLFLLLQYIIPGLFMLITTVIMYVLFFGRFLELGVRTIFAPIGLADAFTHGIHSPGMRYLKKYFAVALQGAVMVAIIFAMGALMNQLATPTDIVSGVKDAFGTLFSQVIIGISGIGLLVKSQSLVNDIVGV